MRPPMAGPVIAQIWKADDVIATARGNSSSFTSCGSMADIAGAAKARAALRRNRKRYTGNVESVVENDRALKAARQSVWVNKENAMTLRLSKRSAACPAIGSKARFGRN